MKLVYRAAIRLRMIEWVLVLSFMPSLSACADEPPIGLTPVREWDGKITGSKFVAFTPDGKRALSAGRELIIWDIQTGNEVQRLAASGMGVALSADGRRFLAGNLKTVKLWDIDNGQLIRDFATLEGQVYAVAFSPDGRYIAWGTGEIEAFVESREDDFFIQIWDLHKNSEKARLVAHKGPVLALAFTLDGKRLLSTSSDLTIRLWDIEAAIELKRSIHQPRPSKKTYPVTLAISPDGRQVLQGSGIWEIESLKYLRGAKKNKEDLDRSECGAFSPDGKRVLSGFYRGSLCLWDAESGEVLDQIYPFKNHATVTGVAISPDGQFALSGGEGSIPGFEAMTRRVPASDPVKIRLWRLPK